MIVSVIIPIYNLEPYIKNSVSSVLNQKFDGEIEVIVVDDGSVDNSLAVAEKLAAEDSRVKVIHQENRGVSAARNAGLDAAQGKYIMFVDGDDIIASNSVKLLIDGFEKSENAVVSCGMHTRISSYEHKFDVLDVACDIAEIETVLERILLGRYDISACAKMFIREKIGNLRFCEGKRINEDKYFLFKYLLENKGSVVNINQNIYGYYVREGSASNSCFTEKTLDMIYFSKEIEKDIKDELPKLNKAARYNNIVAHLAVLKKIARSKAIRENKKLYNDVKKETVLLSYGVSKSFLREYMVEILVLRVMPVLYPLCVRIFDIIKK